MIDSDCVFKTPMTTPAIRYRSAYVAPVRDQSKKSKKGGHYINMNTQMGSSLPSEKLDRSNYSSWE
mgnify:FL=1